jgi:hypothetical protein
MSQLPPFTIISFEQTDMLDDTGDDVVFFHVDLEIDAQLYHCMVPFYTLAKHLAATRPADANYFDKLRSSLTGFGPKETVVLRLAEEEGYDIEKAVSEFIANNATLEKLTPINKKQTDMEHAAVSKKFEELEAYAQDMKTFNLRDITFKDEVMDLLNKKVLEIYPEIFNSRPEYITKLKSLLIDHVLNFGADINSLAWKAYKEP